MFSDLQYNFIIIILISSLLYQSMDKAKLQTRAIMDRLFMKHGKLATVQSVGKKGPCGRGNVA